MTIRTHICPKLYLLQIPFTSSYFIGTLSARYYQPLFTDKENPRGERVSWPGVWASEK